MYQTHVFILFYATLEDSSNGHRAHRSLCPQVGGHVCNMLCARFSPKDTNVSIIILIQS